MYAPGTIVVASDRRYIVDANGSWRVLDYKESSNGRDQSVSEVDRQDQEATTSSAS